jgi:hypothetical protein
MHVFVIYREYPGSDKVRSNLHVATKFAAYPWRVTPGNIVAACKGSLRRTGLQQISLGQLHWSAAKYAPLQVCMRWHSDCIKCKLCVFGVTGACSRPPPVIICCASCASNAGIMCWMMFFAGALGCSRSTWGSCTGALQSTHRCMCVKGLQEHDLAQCLFSSANVRVAGHGGLRQAPTFQSVVVLHVLAMLTFVVGVFFSVHARLQQISLRQLHCSAADYAPLQVIALAGT